MNLNAEESPHNLITLAYFKFNTYSLLGLMNLNAEESPHNLLSAHPNMMRLLANEVAHMLATTNCGRKKTCTFYFFKQIMRYRPRYCLNVTIL